jgi:hypothetical protein
MSIRYAQIDVRVYEDYLLVRVGEMFVHDLAFNHIDARSRGKSLGGRLGIDTNSGFGIGISGYSGPYTVDGRQNLHIGDVDVSARLGQLSSRSASS